jgi:hypothetical protein
MICGLIFVALNRTRERFVQRQAPGKVLTVVHMHMYPRITTNRLGLEEVTER